MTREDMIDASVLQCRLPKETLKEIADDLGEVLSGRKAYGWGLTISVVRTNFRELARSNS